MNTFITLVPKRVCGANSVSLFSFSLKTRIDSCRMAVDYRTNWTRENLWSFENFFMHESLRPLLMKIYHTSLAPWFVPTGISTLKAAITKYSFHNSSYQ